MTDLRSGDNLITAATAAAEWYDQSCSRAHHFVCRVPARETTSAALHTLSAAAIAGIVAPVATCAVLATCGLAYTMHRRSLSYHRAEWEKLSTNEQPSAALSPTIGDPLPKS